MNKSDSEQLSFFGFRLTIRNVNELMDLNKGAKVIGFRLTIRNVNKNVLTK